MAFDWNKESQSLEQTKEPEGFSWDTHSTPVVTQESPITVQEKKPETSRLMSAVSGLGQGATFGFGDELAGASGAIIDSIMDDQSKPFIERYREARDFARNLNQKAKESHPIIYGGSELAGGIASTAPFTAAAAGASAPQAFGKVLPALLKGGKTARLVGEGAALGGLSALGGSQADLTQGEGYNLAGDVATGAVLGGATAGAFKAAASGLGKILPKKLTDKAEEAIADKVGALREEGAIPEAKILEDLGADAGTEAGQAVREKALMSPLTREEKSKTFMDETQNVFDQVKKNFKEFEGKIRPEEAKRNLANVPVDKLKAVARMAAGSGKEVAEGMMDDANKLLYDQTSSRYMYKFLDDLESTVTSADTSQEVYQALNEAKKNISQLAKYGRDVGPLERGTIQQVEQVKRNLTNMLESPEIFGDQALRHKAINAAENKYYTALDNLEGALLQDQATLTGRPEKVFASRKLGTYARQLDTIHGLDKIKYFDDFLNSAENLYKMINDSPIRSEGAQKTAQTLANFRTLKDQFTKDMTLSNQLRRLRWDKMVEQGATPLQEKLPSILRQTQIPGLDLAAQVLTRGEKKADDAVSLIKNLLSKEKQIQTGQNVFEGAVRGAGSMIGKGLEKVSQFAPFAGMAAEQGNLRDQPDQQYPKKYAQNASRLGAYQGVLQSAESRGALPQAHHVLMQQDPKYRALVTSMEDENE